MNYKTSSNVIHDNARSFYLNDKKRRQRAKTSKGARFSSKSRNNYSTVSRLAYTTEQGHAPSKNVSVQKFKEEQRTNYFIGKVNPEPKRALAATSMGF